MSDPEFADLQAPADWPDSDEPTTEPVELAERPRGRVLIAPRESGRGYVVMIDGVDIGHMITPTELQIGFTGDCKPWVHLRLLPSALTAELPDSVLSAIEHPLIGPDE